MWAEKEIKKKHGVRTDWILSGCARACMWRNRRIEFPGDGNTSREGGGKWLEAKKVRKRQIKKTRPDLTSIRDDKALIYTRNTGIFSAIIPFRYVVRLFRSSSLFFFFITAKLLLLAIHGSFKCIGIYSALDVSGRPRRKKHRRFITAVPSPIYLPLFHKVYTAANVWYGGSEGRRECWEWGG